MKVGLLAQILTIVGPFVVRTVFIRTLGAEYLGLNSLFTSILTVLSLSELGFGTAIVFSMYQAIADDDSDTICALLAAYRKVYRIVGLVILTAGLAVAPFLPKLIRGSYPEDISLTAVYLVFLFNTVCSYFMYAYLGALFSAFQRDDIVRRVSMAFNLVMYALQIAILALVRNYYVYIALMPLFAVLTNLWTAYLAKRTYPQYRPTGTLKEGVKESIRIKLGGLMISRVCEVSRNSFDSIFISMFLGLTEIAIYNNYYYVMNSVIAVVAILASAILAGAGNSVASETVEKNHADMMRLNFGYMWVGGWCTVCLLCLFQPFMRLWAGAELMLPMSSVVLICLYFYVLKMGDIRSVYVQAKGIWWENRFRALAEAFINITLNYFLGKRFGLNGIIIATLISLFFINFCYGSRLIYKYYFTRQRASDYFIFHGKCALVTGFACAITYYCCNIIPDTIWGFLIRMGICVIIPNLIYLLIYRRTRMYAESMPWLLEKLGINSHSPVYRILISE